MPRDYSPNNAAHCITLHQLLSSLSLPHSGWKHIVLLCSDSLTSLCSPELPGSFPGSHDGSVHLLPLADVSMGADEMDGLAERSSGHASTAVEHPTARGKQGNEQDGLGFRWFRVPCLLPRASASMHPNAASRDAPVPLWRCINHGGAMHQVHPTRLGKGERNRMV